MSIEKKSTYVCPECGNEEQDRPVKVKYCSGHSKRVLMIEKKKGVVTK